MRDEAAVAGARRAIADPRVGDQTYIPQSFIVAKYIFHMNGVGGWQIANPWGGSAMARRLRLYSGPVGAFEVRTVRAQSDHLTVLAGLEL